MVQTRIMEDEQAENRNDAEPISRQLGAMQ